MAGEDGAASPDVDVADVHDSAGRPASVGEFSPGKDADVRDGEDVCDGEVSSVADYVTAIQVNWQRGVDAFMSIARLCAEANARLTTAQKLELIQVLPFGQTTFSKFVQIGTDTRLNAPDIKRLLPPHYTMLYAVTLLTDEELKQSIAENVIHPDMKRDDLQKWRNSRQRLASSPKEFRERYRSRQSGDCFDARRCRERCASFHHGRRQPGPATTRRGSRRRGAGSCRDRPSGSVDAAVRGNSGIP